MIKFLRNKHNPIGGSSKMAGWRGLLLLALGGLAV